MTEDWDAELGTEHVTVIPSFDDVASVMNDDINGNQSSDLKEHRKWQPKFNGHPDWRPRRVDNQGFSQNATYNENEFDVRAGRRCGFGRGDHGGFPRMNIQNACGDSPVGRGGPAGRGVSSARGGFGAPSGEGDGGFGLNRGKAGFGSAASRGGYRGRNEEPFSGSGSKLRGHWDPDSADGDDKNQGPKVTYVPPAPPEEEDAIFAQYQTGINFDKYDEILVDVSGFNVPPAILTFDEAHLCETLNTNIRKAGYLKPTPVQKHGIPIVLSGRDLMACAQTGSGKTAAFLLPIIEMLLRGKAAADRFKELQEPEVVIVAPTRELINQIYLEARKFSYGTVVRPVVLYGGTSIGHQIRQVLQGCNILCGTPGRLLDIISKGKVALGKVQYLILDEADRMLDMGFEPDMRKLVDSLGMPLKQNRQTLMFSATFPGEIQRLAADFMRSDYLFLAVGQVGGACGDVQQSVLQVDQYSKRNKLVEILTNIGIERTMVFVDTKRKADFLAAFLCQEKFPTTSIHGDREQREREIALGDFRTGKCPILVATAVAARGLDIEHVQHVINFDLPSTIDEYVHRIGRTGRCGHVGKAISFFDSNTDMPIARALLKVLSDAQQEVPIWLEEFAYAAHGTSYHNPLGKVFASVDTRKSLGVNRNFSGYEASVPVTYGGNEEDIWE